MKILRFTAAWCNPCKALDTLVATIEHNPTIEKIDIDTDDKTPVQYRVRSIPMMVKIDESGNVLDTVIGVPSKDRLTEFLND